MCAAQAQTYPQIQTHAHLKSSRQRARVDGQVHLVAHIHGDSLDIAWPRWPRSPVPLGKVVGFFCAGGHCLCIQTPRAQNVLSRTCLGTEHLIVVASIVQRLCAQKFRLFSCLGRQTRASATVRCVCEFCDVNVFCAGGWCWCIQKPHAENVSNHAQV